MVEEHDFKKFPELTNNQLKTMYFDSPHKQILYNFWGNVAKVVDGDTIRVSTSFRDFDTVVRFSNTNAPEMNEGGQESKDWLKDQIDDKEIYIVLDDKRVGKYGRIIGTIMYAGQNINDLSLLMGQSVEFGTPDPFKIQDPMKDIENALKRVA